MAAEAAQFVVMPALAMGLAIGIYEAILLHRDVSVPAHRFGHMVHALLFAVMAAFAAMNVQYVLSVVPALQTVPLLNNHWVFQAAIGLIAMIKIHGVSAAIKGSMSSTVGLGETWFHSLFVGILVALSPQLWGFLVATKIVPNWLLR